MMHYIVAVPSDGDPAPRVCFEWFSTNLLFIKILNSIAGQRSGISLRRVISLLVWTWTLGAMGTILGVPLTLVLNRIYTEYVIAAQEAVAIGSAEIH